MPGTGGIAVDGELQELWDEIEEQFDRIAETNVMHLKLSSTRGTDLLVEAFIRLRDAIKFVEGVQKDLYSLGLVKPD